MRIVHMFMSLRQNQHDETEYIIGKLIAQVSGKRQVSYDSGWF